MQWTQKRLVCLLIAGILLLGCFAGCAPKAEENLGTAVLPGMVSPDSIAIVQGENQLTLTSETEFSKEIEEHLDSVVVNYGWGECNPSKITPERWPYAGNILPGGNGGREYRRRKHELYRIPHGERGIFPGRNRGFGVLSH